MTACGYLAAVNQGARISAFQNHQIATDTHQLWPMTQGSRVGRSKIYNSTILKLEVRWIGIGNNQAQHTLGLNYPALPHQENPLAFFNLLPRFTTHPPPHNREVCL
jgi:hypothetical protein